MDGTVGRGTQTQRRRQNVNGFALDTRTVAGMTRNRLYFRLQAYSSEPFVSVGSRARGPTAQESLHASQMKVAATGIGWGPQ